MREKLVYLSHCATHDDGKVDPFVLQELPWLEKRFDTVMVASHAGVWTDAKDIHHRKAMRPVPASLRACFAALFLPDFWRETRYLLREKKFSPRSWLKLYAFTQRGLKIHYWLEWLLQGQTGLPITLYSGWMSYDAFAAALTKRKHPNLRFIARGHAFDIDIERNPMNPYLMKQTIANQANGLYLISETAKNQLMDYMARRIDKEKVHVLAMGSGGSPVDHIEEAPRFSQGIFRIVSCAMVIPIKQVEHIVEALSCWEGGLVCWTHIGGGEGEERLHQLVSEKLDLKENVICDLLGTMDPSAVSELYDRRTFDVFVNTSRKEGMPVSIMEAMRHGIPVIAPAVGGLPEMITPDVGYLYAPERGAEGLLEKLTAFSAMGVEETAAMRTAAKKRWDEEFCSEALLPKLFD